MTRIAPSTHASRPRPTRRTSPAAAWLTWSVALAATVIFASFTAVLTLWGKSSTCNDPATPAQRAAGLHDLAVAAAIFAGVWLVVAAIRRQHWRRHVIGALLGVIPLVLAFATHRHVQDWVGGFCF